MILLCDRRIWRKIDMLKSGGDLTAGCNETDEDEDESAKWSWYIS